MRIYLTNRSLFIKKTVTLLLTTLALVPLVHYKLMVPAVVYVAGLLLLHAFFLYLYFSRVPWQEFKKDKKGLTLRIVALTFFIYLLMLIKFEGSTITVLLNLAGAFIIHVFILLFLMVIKVKFDKN